MKWIVVAVILMVTGCAAISNSKGAMQPVLHKDINNRIYFTTCSGTVEEWGSCNVKAKDTCPNGYEELEKIESPVGGKRELTFQCH